MVLAISVSLAVLGCAGSPKSAVANPSATQTQLTTSSAAPAIGNSVTLSASVVPINGNGTPTGAVTFLNDPNILGTAQLSAGNASLSTSSLTIGSHVITANYNGDSSFSASNSSSSVVDVTSSSTISLMVQDGTGNSAQQTLNVTVR